MASSGRICLLRFPTTPRLLWPSHCLEWPDLSSLYFPAGVGQLVLYHPSPVAALPLQVSPSPDCPLPSAIIEAQVIGLAAYMSSSMPSASPPTCLPLRVPSSPRNIADFSPCWLM